MLEASVSQALASMANVVDLTIRAEARMAELDAEGLPHRARMIGLLYEPTMQRYAALERSVRGLQSLMDEAVVDAETGSAPSPHALFAAVKAYESLYRGVETAASSLMALLDSEEPLRRSGAACERRLPVRDGTAPQRNSHALSARNMGSGARAH